MSHIIRHCKQCNQPFKAPLKEVSRGNAHYCSLSCVARHSIETKPKHTLTCRVCKEMFYSTSRIAFYCSNVCKLKNYRTRKHSGNKYDRYLEAEIRNYPCEVCAWSECSRDVHHITPVSKGGKSTYENLISLCPNHHKMADLGLLSQDYLIQIVKSRTISSSLQQILNKIYNKEQDANLVIKDINNPPVVSEPSQTSV